jgi:phenylacetate-CoA ligase
MAAYYDELETRDPSAREAALMDALPNLIAQAKANAPYYAETLADIEPAAVSSREALAALPITRKSALIERQAQHPPFGGLTTAEPRAFGRLFLSPGPIAEPQSREGDWWRMARALFAAGFREGDLIHNCFAYTFTPAGMAMDAAATALGCAVFPGGIGNTEGQVQAIAHFRADGYSGTPDFLKIILDKAREMDTDISSLRRALVSGGALPPSLRQEIKTLGVDALQCYGTAELGLVAYESEAMEGMIVDESVILEIVRPGTGEPVTDGDVGEVVVTTFNPDYPLIRFGTGDLSAIMSGASPCGRTAPRIKGWMGRADQTTKVRGMFVHPEQIDRVVKQHPEIAKARLVVDSQDNRDTVTLHCEVAGGGGDALATSIAKTAQAECKVRATVAFSAPGELPNDGKVIEDIRKYD